MAEIRRASESDAAILASLRYEFRAELDPPTEDRDLFVGRMQAWLIGRLGGNWLAWLALEGRTPIGEIFLCLVEKLPNPVEEPELLGYISSLYVRLEHRNRNVGSYLLDVALEHCRRRIVDTVVLWPSRRSRSLYARKGFVGSGSVMELALADHLGRAH